jgi:hypothetical protein
LFAGDSGFVSGLCRFTCWLLCWSIVFAEDVVIAYIDEDVDLFPSSL